MSNILSDLEAIIDTEGTGAQTAASPPPITDDPDAPSLLGDLEGQLAVEEAQLEDDNPLFGEFGRGIQRGGLSTVGLAQAAGSAAASLVGADETASKLAQAYQDTQRDVARFSGKVTGVENIESFDDFLSWASGTLGESVPSLLSVVAGGGVSGIVGRLVAKKAITKVAGRELAKKLARVTATSATAGAAGTSGVLNTGGIAGEQIENFGSVTDPGVAVLGGAAAGALDAFTPLAIMNKVGLTKGGLSQKFANLLFGSETGKSLKRRIGTGIARGVVAEGLTEELQEEIAMVARNIVDETNPALLTFDEQSNFRRLNALAAGTLAGGVFGGVFSAVPQRKATTIDIPLPDDPVEPRVVNEATDTAVAIEAASAVPEVFEEPTNQPSGKFFDWTQIKQDLFGNPLDRHLPQVEAAVQRRMNFENAIEAVHIAGNLGDGNEHIVAIDTSGKVIDPDTQQAIDTNFADEINAKSDGQVGGVYVPRFVTLQGFDKKNSFNLVHNHPSFGGTLSGGDFRAVISDGMDTVTAVRVNTGLDGEPITVLYTGRVTPSFKARMDKLIPEVKGNRLPETAVLDRVQKRRDLFDYIDRKVSLTVSTAANTDPAIKEYHRANNHSDADILKIYSHYVNNLLARMGIVEYSTSHDLPIPEQYEAATQKILNTFRERLPQFIPSRALASVVPLDISNPQERRNEAKRIFRELAEEFINAHNANPTYHAGPSAPIRLRGEVGGISDIITRFGPEAPGSGLGQRPPEGSDASNDRGVPGAIRRVIETSGQQAEALADALLGTENHFDEVDTNGGGNNGRPPVGRPQSSPGGNPPRDRGLRQDLDTFNKAWKWLASVPQILKQNMHIPGIPQYQETIFRFQRTANVFKEIANDRLRQWSALGKEQIDNLGNFLLDLQVDASVIACITSFRWSVVACGLRADRD